MIESLLADLADGRVVAPLGGLLVGVLLSLSPLSLPGVAAAVATVSPGRVSPQGVRERLPLRQIVPVVVAFVVGMDGVLAVLGYVFVQVTVAFTRASVVLHVVAVGRYTLPEQVFAEARDRLQGGPESGEGRPTEDPFCDYPGKPKLTHTHEGVTYQFHSQPCREAFRQQMAASGAWKQQLRATGGWYRVAVSYFNTLSKIYKTVIYGFLLAGFIVGLVPADLWAAVFIEPTNVDALGWIPQRPSAEGLGAFNFELNFTLVMTVLALVGTAALYLVMRRGGAVGDADDDGDEVRDPICGVLVNRDVPAATRERDGHTYYFTSRFCARAFDRTSRPQPI